MACFSLPCRWMSSFDGWHPTWQSSRRATGRNWPGFEQGAVAVADIWQALQAAAQENKVVSVSLTPGARVARPKRRVGRPCTRGTTRFGHYEGYDSTTGGRPRCALHGCGKYLKKNQRIACCQDHETKAVEAAQRLLERVKREAA